MDKKLAEDTLKKFEVQLLNVLPFERPGFLAKLNQERLIPGGADAPIREERTRAKKVEYYLQNVVKPTPHIYLPGLIAVMEKYDDLAVQALAKDMKKCSGIAYVNI